MAIYGGVNDVANQCLFYMECSCKRRDCNKMEVFCKDIL